ncbi:MAG TPA: gamma-glutamyltransferase family protein [Bryobacteraceae bacterium]|nr:gamma-glutamyltransferase family protein [Bryobacteraceae bacterium]
MHRRIFLIAVTVAATQCFAQSRRPDPPVRQPVRGTHGAVAAGSDWATNAGMRLYDQGGTAVDAGVAAMFAASVTELSHFGMGGEAPILIRTKAGRVYSIAGVGTMPKLATADFFRKRKVELGDVTFRESGETHLKGIIPDAGLMPALVPGMVDAGLVALREFGTKSFAQVIAPAIELADGYALDDMRARSFAGAQPFLELWPTSKAHFMPNGHTPGVGEIFHQPDLAKTLRAMAAAEKKALAAGAKREAAIDAVRDYFYRGEIARKIDAFSKANGGLLRYEDMAAFRLTPEEPLSTTFRGLIVYKPGFWSQGPAMLQALNIIEGFDGKMALNSADYLHRQAEAMKLAYADRDTYYADPKFSHLNVQSLLTKEYAAERRKLIGPKASMEFRPGPIDGKTGRHPSLSEMASYKIDDVLMAHDTTCVDTMDSEGIVFSATPSGAWMPSVIAGDTGIPLTQRAQSFVLIPGHPNELAGGKRPRVTLSPTLVTLADGKPFLALSTPGADNQEQSLIQIMMNVIDYGMNAQNAIENPRYQTRHLVASLDEHAWSVGDLMLDERIPQSVAMDLLARGHKVQIMSRYNNGAAPVMIKLLPGGIIEAGADPFYNRSARAR